MKQEWIEVSGQRLEVARWGQGAGLPILLLHEGLGSVGMWKDFPARLAAASSREVIAWSRRGHGNSGWSVAVFEPGYMHDEAALLPEVHRALGIERAYWLGHSDGGSIALIGAALHPGLVAGIILEAPHVFVEDITVMGIAEAAVMLDNARTLERMARYHARPREMLCRWRDIWLSPPFREWNIEGLLPKIASPILLIQGVDDQYGTLEQLQRIEVALPGASRVMLGNCAHSPHIEQQDTVLDVVCRFVEGKE
jgi:pimeloyl-ACP methyl ester carboxylesterase